MDQMNQLLPTIESDVTTETAEADGAASPKCVACKHSWASHDRIAMRFCTATTTEHHTRGCVCPAGD
jgi:hypothetical protein